MGYGFPSPSDVHSVILSKSLLDDRLRRDVMDHVATARDQEEPAAGYLGMQETLSTPRTTCLRWPPGSQRDAPWSCHIWGSRLRPMLAMVALLVLATQTDPPHEASAGRP